MAENPRDNIIRFRGSTKKTKNFLLLQPTRIDRYWVTRNSIGERVFII